MSSDPNSGADALGSQEREEAIQHSAYFVAAGLPLELAGFEFVGEAPSFPLRDGEVLLNEWLAEGLGVTAGEEVDVGYFPVGSRGEGPEEQVTWRVAGVVKTKGSGADSGLTPSVPGITDADTFADWEQPFEMDLSQVTDRDEEYWDEYRAAPKLFLPLTAMQERFRSRYGAVTSVRVRVPEGEDVDEWKERLSAAVLRKMTPERSGLIVRNVKEEQLAAAAGTTDFSGLFFGFSMFLIASAVLLVALLFRLGVEKRVEQLGLLSAVGFGPKRATRLVLAEGAVVAVLGGLFGLLLAVVYAGVMIHGLKTWWGGAIGTQFLTLHVKPAAMLIGFFASVWMALAAMWFAVRKLRALSPRQLMAGRSEPSLDEAGVRSRGGQARRVAAWSAGVVVLLLVGLMTGLIPDVEAFAGFSVRVVAFFLVGFVALVAAVAGLSATLDQKTGTGAFSLPVLGWRNTARARSRSLLTGGLIASATFVLVAVAVARKDPTGEAPKVDSGNGGYSLVAETSVPILFDLNTEAGRDKAGFNADEAALEGVDLVGLRMKPGDDASCLNLYQARLPTLLGVPDEVLERWSDEGRWKFADTPQAAQWAGLWNGAAADAYRDQSNTFPVVGDMNTLMYSLKKPIGSLIDVPAGAGPSVSDAKLNVIGMLDGSVFQGVLLMRQSDLLTLFPDLPGDRYFLVECPPVQQDAVAAALESGLADYGFDAEPVAARIANFLAVQNTYLSTFKTLGGLGLLLGTFGLATVMLRNVVERRRELALMRAVGYRPRRLGTLVLGETAGLLLYGLAAGTAAALLAMLPHLNSSGADVPWRSLFGLLAAVFVVGMLAALSAVRRAAKTPLLAGLRSE